MYKQLYILIYFIFITLFLTFFISSCSKNKQKTLNDDTFVEVLSDLMIIENLAVPESDRIILVKQVFEKHNIDSVIFNNTRRRHEENEKYWIKIYSRVEERIQVKLDSLDTLQKNSSDQKKENS